MRFKEHQKPEGSFPNIIIVIAVLVCVETNLRLQDDETSHEIMID